MDNNKNLNIKKIINKLNELNPELSPELLEKAMHTMLDEISLALICGDRVELRGFGSLIVRKRTSSEARNPKSGQKVQVNDHGSLYFRASRKLIEVLNDSASNDNRV